jgi:predicted glycosyltransferase
MQIGQQDQDMHYDSGGTEMRIVVDISHPAHVHYFRNFIWEMEKKHHEIMITASEKEIAYQLLDRYGFNYQKLGSYGDNIVKKIANLPILELKMYQAVKKFNPDLFLGFASIRAAHVSKILGRTAIILDDSEPGYAQQLLYYPFADVILTPSCFDGSFGRKHVKFNGYMELSYLNPKYFDPNKAFIEEMGLDLKNGYILMRFVAWKAYHDIGKKGITKKFEIVRQLEDYAPVYISSESRLPKELEKYRLNIPPERIHDVLFYSKLFFSDSQTMTTEAAILGTPAIRCNSFVGKKDMGNFRELENAYHLIFNFSDENQALEKAIELLQPSTLKKEWEIKKNAMLDEKVDVTAFLIWFIEQYPNSFAEIQKRPEIQYQFRKQSGLSCGIEKGTSSHNL